MIHPRIIAIDGHGGSGKSTLARLLAEKLPAEIVHVDDFTGLDDYYGGAERLKQYVFDPIFRGDKTLNYPRARWGADHHPEPVVDQIVADTMILEGVDSLNPHLRGSIDTSIFVDTPVEICFERGTVRDSGNYGSSDEVEKLWHKWLAKEEKLFNDQGNRLAADIVIEGAKPFDVMAVLAQIKN